MREPAVDPERRYQRDRVRDVEARLAALVHADRIAVTDLRLAGPVDRISYEAAQDLEYRPVAAGAELGPLFATH